MLDKLSFSVGPFSSPAPTAAVTVTGPSTPLNERHLQEIVRITEGYSGSDMAA
eukprot:gene58779-78426_t